MTNDKQRERLVELIIASVNGCARNWAEHISDYLLANGVVAPLLETGQTVYRVSKNRIWEFKIWKVEICNGTVSYVDNYDKSFLDRHIGLGVFLTKEEAEKALVNYGSSKNDIERKED